MAQSLINEIATKKNLQSFIDETQARFASIFHPNFLSKKYEGSLTWETLKGSRKSGVAANVTAYDVSAPLHSRDVVSKLSGSIPSMRGKKAMNEKDMIEYLNLRRNADADQMRILSLIYDDVAWASVAPHKRIDWMVARMLSTGKIALDIDSNGAGMVTTQTVDYQIPSGNKSGVQNAVWSNSAAATPLLDMRKAFFEPMAELGLSGGRIYMHPNKIFQLLAADEVLDVLGVLSSNRVGAQNIQLAHVNDFLAGNGYPTIRPFNASIGIESDGVVSYSNPFEENNIVCLPYDGPIGTLHVGPVVEKERPNPQTSYATYLDNLIKKFSDLDPVREFTAFEMNAFPSFDQADITFLMNSNNVGSFE